MFTKQGGVVACNGEPIYILTWHYNEIVARILAVEDSPEFQVLLAHALGSHHELTILPDASTVVEEVEKILPDLIILDIDLPLKNGFIAAEEIRNSKQTRDIPILFLTAHQEVEYLENGLRLGAEDYLFKPIRPQELKTRCEMRLAKLKENEDNNGVLVSGSFKLNLLTSTAFIMDQQNEISIVLSPMEAKILAVFIKNENRSLNRSEILKLLDEDKEDRILDNHIGSLKKKSPLLAKAIETVYGVGYLFRR